MTKRLYRIEAPHFTAHFVVNGETNIIVESAPILAWCRGKQLDGVASYCQKKSWHIACIDEEEIEKGH